MLHGNNLRYSSFGLRQISQSKYEQTLNKRRRQGLEGVIASKAAQQYGWRKNVLLDTWLPPIQNSQCPVVRADKPSRHTPAGWSSRRSHPPDPQSDLHKGIAEKLTKHKIIIMSRALDVDDFAAWSAAEHITTANCRRHLKADIWTLAESRNVPDNICAQ